MSHSNLLYTCAYIRKVTLNIDIIYVQHFTAPAPTMTTLYFHENQIISALMHDSVESLIHHMLEKSISKTHPL